MTSTTQSRKIADSIVPPIGFGAMGLSQSYGPVGSDEERFQVLDAAHQLGCTHWDTSDLYADSEELIGKWFQRTGKRGDILLASNFGFTEEGIRGDPEYVKHAAQKSLKILGVDYIDLYYAHRVDSNVPIEYTVQAMAELVKEGKVKYLGLSECSAKTLRRAHAIHPIAAVQVEVSPFCLDIFDPKLDLLRTARELGVKIVCYSPLGRGLLTGRFKSVDDFHRDDFRRAIPKFSETNFPKIHSLISELEEVGKKHGATAGQASIAWLLAQGDDFFVIPGTKNIKYLIENIEAGSLKLSEAEVNEIKEIAYNAEIPGDRYNAEHQALIFGDTPELGEGSMLY